VIQNYVKAVRILRKLAKTSAGQHGTFELGDMYLDGLGVKKDLTEAYAWYSVGSLLGIPLNPFDKFDAGWNPDKKRDRALEQLRELGTKKVNAAQQRAEELYSELTR
jgi:TPR repeat protein